MTAPSMLEIRRRVLQAMANGNNVKIKTGTFNGDDSNSVTIACDFYPDVILVSLDADSTLPVSYVGVCSEAIWRNQYALAIYYNATTGNSKISYPKPVADGMTSYNETTYASREVYATVTGSAVTISNNTGSNAFGKFASGYTYKYVIIKYTED